MAAEKTKPAKEAVKAAPKKIKARKKDKKNVPSVMLILRAHLITPLFQSQIQQVA